MPLHVSCVLVAEEAVSAMSSDRELSGVAETLLIPLYVRALESQRPDALLRDERAVALVAERAADFAPIERIKMDEEIGLP